MAATKGRPPEGRAGTRVRDYPQLSIRLPQTWVDTFNRGARANKESRAKFLIRLLKAYGS